MKKKYIVHLAVIVVFITLQLFLKSYIAKQPEYREIMVANPFNTLPPAEYLGTYVSTIALGGFKPLLVDYLWMKQDKLQEDKQFEEIVLLLSIIARLQPRFTEVWSFNAYHMIYNIAAQENTPEAKWHWVKSGMDYIKEGMRFNPDNVELTQWLAFFYYHRIPQDAYFMQQVESAEGTDTYEVASRWYWKAIDICKEKNLPGTAELYGVMFFACRFRHSFELAKKNRFDEAIKELEVLTTATRGTMEIERMKDLISVLQYDKEVSLVEMNSPDYISRNLFLLEQYGNTVNRHVGYDFTPINARVELILRRYIKYAYHLIDSGKYDEASEVIKLLRQAANKIAPKLDNHPARWYYLTLSERFEQLEGMVDAECSLKAQGVKDFRTDRRGMELKTLYEEYIGKYSSHWLLGDEKERFNNLMGEPR
jgi:tetratricopeptide (TPR) repeat protein